MRIILLIQFLLFSVYLNSQILINEIYGGGGNTGATWTRDVVQLINIGGSSVDLTGYAIQYASEGGSSWNVDPIPDGTIIASGAILNVMLASGGANGSTPPQPNVQALAGSGGLINMSARAGKVALTINTTALSGTDCPTGAVDYVGYGNTGSQTCGPHTDATIPANNNTSGYKRTNLNIPGSFIINSSPLPVDFLKMNIFRDDLLIFISFSTASETNNDYFSIERSGDGRSFVSIGEIRGAGDSREERHYSFTDEKPLPGVNYYRIKQTDFDGKYSYSEIKSVRFSIALPFDITPRQTEGSLLVATEIENYSLHVLDSGGRLLLSLSNLAASQNIDLNAFKPGIYYVRLIHDGVSETKRIVRI